MEYLNNLNGKAKVTLKFNNYNIEICEFSIRCPELFSAMNKQQTAWPFKGNRLENFTGNAEIQFLYKNS